MRYLNWGIIPVISVFLLVGCGKDENVAPPWENDSRAENPGNINENPGYQPPASNNPATGGGNSDQPAPNPVTTGGNAGALSGLFPNGLLDARGNQISPSKLNGKYVGIYFSAHWCQPCHEFTPSLVDFRNRNSGDFEVVFVSLCNSDAEKAAYMDEMGMKWLTTPGPRSDQGARLAKRFSVEAIPQMVVLTPNGKVVTVSGQKDVAGNPGGALAKWKKG